MTGSLLVDVETDSGLIPLTRASEFTVSVRIFTCSGVAVPIFGAPVDKAICFDLLLWCDLMMAVTLASPSGIDCCLKPFGLGNDVPLLLWYCWDG